tara:strand:+ start:1497 stop:1826 length:330 start_codon:yes stop_codon:yes gene_type:complete
MQTSIGRMRHRITIQKGTDTVDTGGGRSVVWATLKEVFADIQPQGGASKYRQDQVQENVTHKIVMRYRSDIGTNYRIKFGTRIFNIHSILNESERDRYLVLNCEEGVAT